MWIGKLALILYCFSFGMLFFGYYLNQMFHNGTLDSITYQSLDVLANKNEIHQDINASLIFGDFLAALKVLFGIVTGDTITSAFHLLPFVDTSILLLVRIVFTFSSALLWIYVVANRSL